MKLIPLTRGKFSKIDDCDFERVSQYNWSYSTSHHGQIVICAWVDGRCQHLSRFIMQPPKGMVVDHINADRLDNRRQNLRVCTQRQNISWRRVFTNTTPFRGVRLCKDSGRKTNRWQARIKYHNQELHLGRYSTAEEAAYIYDQVAIQLNGEFARLNLLEV